MTPNGSNDPRKLNKNHVAVLVSLLVMVMVAAHSGYRLHIGPSGITFEQNAQITQR
ncbi:hypothetical protein GGD64_005613 [Bradyrhizobium sp. CIR3A]|nr:hypothetical protein [Bradyrhizobium sp. CIR3A]